MKKAYNKKSKEDKEKEVNELLEKAQEGIKKCFTSPEHFKELVSYMSKFYNYSLRNTFLIQDQFKGALAVGSYAFWKEKGFTVNKGEKGIKILVPNKLSDYFINSKGEEVKLSKATPEEKNLIEQGEIEVKKGKLIFNQGYVFEVTQTNAKAEDLPKIFPGRWLDGEVNNYNLMYKAMENIANKIGVKIIAPKKELGAVKGVSYPATKEVALNPRNTQLQNVKTLIHELTHAKLHTMETRDNYTKNEKEFQAEMSAYAVCSYFGLDTSEYSFRYIKSWTENVELKDKEKLINEVRETVKEYIDVIEKTLVNDKDLSLSLEKENSIEKREEKIHDKNLYEIKEQEVMNNNNIKENVYKKWLDKYFDGKEIIQELKEELSENEKFIDLVNAKLDLELEYSEAYEEIQRYDEEISTPIEILEKKLEVNNYLQSFVNKEINKIVGYGLEEDNYIEREFATIEDIKLKDGSFIEKGTSFFITDVIKDDNIPMYRAEFNGIEEIKYFYDVHLVECSNLLKEKGLINHEVEEERENDSWKLTDKEIAEAERLIELEAMKENIEKLMKENYEDFIKSILSIESGIEDLDLLDNIYEKYIDNDFKLINDKFEDLKNEIERESLDMRDEKKEKEIWRRIREHEEWIKSNGLRGQQLNLENENLSGMRLINLDLRDANFKGADMTQCVVFADLRGANLTGVKINNSEWIGSNINNVTIEANKLNLIEYQMEQEKDLHLSSMAKLKTKTKEKEIKM
ncbi:ImmA/IrrE family metallo-endopeptidase [Clostridium saudiense]|uniref:ImmA/IrrE family metallo-endopeptidase n=1 Tax=Clostridium saudiense TaxID=1414720 RepID=UPI002671373B|nr:ImmA/IrrE family metallo-endopeptidase [Clostridium saudiense]